MIEDIKKFMIDNGITQTRLAELLDCSEGTVSLVLNEKQPMSKSFKKNIQYLMKSTKPTVFNGDNHNINIHDGSKISEQATPYSPAFEALKGIAETLSESKRWKLVGLAVDMQEETNVHR